MAKTKKLSIIVPVYNVAPYLKQCLDSISQQTFKAFECIIVDDGSTDNSGKICAAFALKDQRFRVITQPNLGVNFARVEALQQAVGEHIGFVDADDYIAKDMFAALMNTALENDADIVFCDWVELKKKNHKEVVSYKAGGQITKEIVMQDLASDQLRSYLWNKLFKRKLLDATQILITAKNMGDYSWMHYIFHKAERFFYVKRSLYFYRERENSIMGATGFFKKMESYEIAKERGEFYKNYYPQMATLAQVPVFKFGWKLCKDYACPKEENKEKTYREADAFVRTFFAQYLQMVKVGKKEYLSILLYINFTQCVRRWKILKSKF